MTIATLLSACAKVQAAPLGQWIWSQRDSAALVAARQSRPDVEAAVLVAELDWNGTARTQLRLSPAVVSSPQAIVVRLGDSFDAAWDSASDATMASEVGDAIAQVLEVAQASGFAGRTVQIDYDCPTRQLHRYAHFLRSLHASTLRGYDLWITTLVAQLRVESFGALFSDAITGHIVQLFDTGEVHTVESERALLGLVERAALPFRIGLGGFERLYPGGRLSEHSEWENGVSLLATSRWFRGSFIFAAGLEWISLARRMP